MGSFFGALILTGVAAATHLVEGGRSTFPLILLYLGVIVITLAVHVPLNDAVRARRSRPHPRPLPGTSRVPRDPLDGVEPGADPAQRCRTAPPRPDQHAANPRALINTARGCAARHDQVGVPQ